MVTQKIHDREVLGSYLCTVSWIEKNLCKEPLYNWRNYLHYIQPHFRPNILFYMKPAFVNKCQKWVSYISKVKNLGWQKNCIIFLIKTISTLSFFIETKNWNGILGKRIIRNWDNNLFAKYELFINDKETAKRIWLKTCISLKEILIYGQGEGRLPRSSAKYSLFTAAVSYVIMSTFYPLDNGYTNPKGLGSWLLTVAIFKLTCLVRWSFRGRSHDWNQTNFFGKIFSNTVKLTVTA